MQSDLENVINQIEVKTNKIAKITKYHLRDLFELQGWLRGVRTSDTTGKMLEFDAEAILAGHIEQAIDSAWDLLEHLSNAKASTLNVMSVHKDA